MRLITDSHGALLVRVLHKCLRYRVFAVQDLAGDVAFAISLRLGFQAKLKTCQCWGGGGANAYSALGH